MFTDHPKMVKTLVKPGRDIVATLTDENAHFLHMAAGLAGEVGELLTCVTGTNGAAEFIKELGDVEFYLTGFSQGLGVAFESKRVAKAVCWDSQGFYVRLIITAAGLLDEAKKAAVYNKPLNVSMATILTRRLRRQLDILYAQSGAVRGDVLEANMDKLSARFPSGGYTDTQAIDRKDQG